MDAIEVPYGLRLIRDNLTHLAFLGNRVCVNITAILQALIERPASSATRQGDQGKTGAKRRLRGGFHVWMPALEAFAQITIESLGAGLKQEVCATLGPAHLLLFDHAAG